MNETAHKTGTSRLLLVFLAVGLPCLALAAVVAWALIARPPQTLPFDAAIWRNPESSRWRKDDVTERQKMFDDLVANHLSGKTRGEIESMLGEPDTGYFEGTGRDLLYILGPERGPFGIDSEWLLIWFDGNGVFGRWAMMRD